MNERIQKLAEQNGFIHDHMSVGERNDALKKFEKIAGLIVKECINTIEEKFTRHSVTGSVRNTDYNIGLSTAVEAIEEHFGVEE